MVFQSVTSEFGLFCDRRYLRELCKFLIIGVASVMVFGVSWFQDHFGRKTFILSSFALEVAGILCVVWGTSLIVVMAGLVMLWSFIEIAYILLIVLSNELLVNPIRKYAQNIFAIVTVFGGAFGNFLTHYASSYQSILLVVFLGHLLAVSLVMCLLPESPSFLLKQLEYGKLHYVIEGMCRTNRLSPTETRSVLLDLDSALKCKATLW